jgi:tRNA pseudouridine55 synthase
VTVHEWDIRHLDDKTLKAVITCSGGTYIRALARDLGRATNSAAHLSALRRTRIGKFDLRDAHSLETLSSELAPLRPLRVVADD